MIFLAIVLGFSLVVGVIEFRHHWQYLPRSLKIRAPLTLAATLAEFFLTIPLVFGQRLSDQIIKDKSRDSIRPALKRRKDW